MISALKKAGIEDKYFDTGEVKLNYVVGPVNGPPIVFCPAQWMTWEEYELVMPDLSRNFQVFAVTLRGHGKSTQTPGKYTFNTLGHDMTLFLCQVVKKPAIVTGNSSGGVLAAWLAAYAPEWVKAVVEEDPPLFRCDWEHIKGTQVFHTFSDCVTKIGTPGGGGLPRFFAEVEVPSEPGKEVFKIPKGVSVAISKIIALNQWLRPGQPVNIPGLPPQVRLLIKGMSVYDPDFSRAFVEGTVGKDLDHATMLSKIKVPMLFFHAPWFLTEEKELVGALDDNDVQRVQSLVQGGFECIKMDCGHFIALEKPDIYIREVKRFAERL